MFSREQEHLFAVYTYKCVLVLVFPMSLEGKWEQVCRDPQYDQVREYELVYSPKHVGHKRKEMMDFRAESSEH